MIKVNLVIVGGGPAGLAAAKSAYDAGERDILILEREAELGGILNQCIHNGFGLHTFKEELTGPEYAARYVDEVTKRNITYKLNATVIDVSCDKTVTYRFGRRRTGASSGKSDYSGLRLPRTSARSNQYCRYARRGVFRRHCAKLVNIDGYLPGKEVVILGSGDIGLIMARRMTFEGALRFGGSRTYAVFVRFKP